MKVVYNFFIMAVALVSIGCSDANKEKSQATAMPPLPVSVMKVKEADIPIVLNYSGTTTSQMNVIIKAKVTGTIEKQFFKAGQIVNKGDKLYLIDQSKYKASYDSALANLGVSQANFKNAEAGYNRSKTLYESKALSTKEYDLSLADYKSSQAAVLASKANVENAKIDLDYSIVTAPFTGVVGDTLKDVGSYVSPSDGDLVRLTELNPIFVNFSISDVDKLNIDKNTKDKEWVQLNSLVTMHMNGKDYNGSLVFIDKVINAKSGTVSAKAEFENNSTDIKPGAFAKVILHGFYQKNGFKIPLGAILQDISGPFIYTLKDGKVNKSFIKIASQDPLYAVVSSGLKDGETIILDNYSKIKVGQTVHPLPENKGGM